MAISYGTKQAIKGPPDFYGNGQSTGWVIPMTSTTFLTVYTEQISVANNIIYARAYTRSGTAVSGSGSEVTAVASGANNFCVCRMNSTQALLIWRAGSGSTTYGLVLTVTGTAVAVGAASASTAASIYFSSCPVGSAKALFAYERSNLVRTKIVTIGAGPTVTFSGETNTSTGDTYGTRCCQLTTDRAMLIYDLGPGSTLKARVIDCTAGTPSISAVLTVYGARASTTFDCLGLRSDRAAVAWKQYSAPDTTYIRTIKDQGGFLAPTLNSNALTITPARERFALSFIDDDGTDGDMLLFTRDDADHDLKATWFHFETGGAVPDQELITQVEEVQHEADPGAGHWWTPHNAQNFGGTAYHVYGYTDHNFGAAPDEYTMYARIFGATSVKIDYEVSPGAGWSPKCMDVSPDDVYLHLGLVEGGNPVALRMLADLSADPVETYAPGAGTAIGVQCGDLVEERVWIAGDFGVPKVRLSLDDGTTWTTKDPGTWSGTALPHLVGPDDDDLVLVPTDGDDDLFQTWDGGLNWDTLNDSLPYDIGALDRVYWYLDEMMIGADAAGASRVHYSPNEGATFHDVTAGTPNVAINDLVIG